MGAKNVIACFAMWGHLGHREFRLLVGMALTALDPDDKGTNPPFMYFKGETSMAELVGSKPAMYRARKALIDAGAVTVVKAGAPGRRAEYRLNLDPWATVTPLTSDRRTPLTSDTEHLSHLHQTPLTSETGHLSEVRGQGSTQELTRKSPSGERVTESPVSPGLATTLAAVRAARAVS